MGAPKPTLGYPSRTDAVHAMRAQGLDARAIGDRIGIPPETVTALEASASRERRRREGRSGNVRRLSDAQIDEMAALRERGWSCDRIAEHFTKAGTAISGSAIYWQCLRVGADVPRKLRGAHTQPGAPYQRGKHIVRPYTTDDDRRLLELEAAGAKMREIARKLGRAENSIRGRLMTLARRQARAEDLA